MLLTLKLTTLFWFRWAAHRSVKTYRRIRQNRLHFASVVVTLFLLMFSVASYVRSIPPVLAAEEAERIGFIVSTQLHPVTLRSNEQFSLQTVAYAGQNIGGSLPTETPESARQHIVAPGETLSEISMQYGLSSLDFMSANPHLESRDSIFPGQALTVPENAVSPEEAAKLKAELEAKKAQERALAAAKSAVTGARASTTTVAAATSAARAKFVVPIAYRYISQRYGQSGHTGIDYVANTGTPVRAATNGCVIHASTGWNGGYGTVIILKESGTNRSTLYAHLSRMDVGVGDCVSAGQVVARSGNTGRSTGPHLHFEVRVNGKQTNPLSYF